LFAGVGLRNQEVIQIDAQLARIDRIERVLGVHERAYAAGLLRFRNHVQRQSRLARAFRAINFNDAPLRETANAKRNIKRKRASGDRLDLDNGLFAQAHDRAFAEGLIDLLQSGRERLLLVRFHRFLNKLQLRCHLTPSIWPRVQL
jgi:hypothetical protein